MKIFLVITYLIYIIFWETLTIGGCAYIVFKCGKSGWWFVLAVLLSMACLKPHKWQMLFDKEMASEYMRSEFKSKED